MKSRTLIAGLAVCLAAQLTCSFALAAGAGDDRSTSISIDDGVGKATIHGGGVANILGDKVEWKDGTVFVNGQSFGAVPAGAEVKYVVTKTSRTLYVDGKVRTRVDKK